MVTIQRRLEQELIAGGMTTPDAVNLARELAPILTRAINQQRGISMNQRIGAGFSWMDVTAKIHAAVPSVSATDQAAYSVVGNLMRNNPSWTVEQVYAEAVKSFLPKSAGGKLLTRQEVATRQAVPGYLVVGGAVLVVGIGAFLLMRKKRTA